MVMYQIVYAKAALKHIPRLKAAHLDEQTQKLIKLITETPFKNPPPFEELKGEMQGLYSRRINIKHKLAYQIFEKEEAIKIVSMWSHYEY